MTLTDLDQVLIQRVEGVQDAFARRRVLLSLSPVDFARLCELGYASVDAIKWPGLPHELGGEEVWPVAHRDVALATEAARGEREAAHAALERLGATPPGIAVALAGVDDVEAACELLGVSLDDVLPVMETVDGPEGEPDIEVQVGTVPAAALEDGYLFVHGATSEQVAEALIATRPE